ncbi:MAG: c-type cytochrome, partial [Candidatus Promineifilaceae bacterium]|nr:c-type cytochrome [Candidatus Promineifilaceae bacterium]
GERIPASNSVDEAREIIATGGSHETMPVWGEVLTDEQIDALVDYTLEAARGTPIEIGQELYTENCASCHGDLGEGGENPARPGDIIAPISTAEYLKTRDDVTLRNIIAQGQPNFGMSPFGASYGGPLDDEQIDALVAFIRSWESDPPVELPPEAKTETLALSGFEIYSEICAQCHGPSGRGGSGPSLRAATFRNNNTSEDIFQTVSDGHEATQMIAWGSILTSEQIRSLVEYIEDLPIEEEPEKEAPAPEEEEIPTDPDEVEAQEAEEEAEEEAVGEVVSFSEDIMPIMEFRCIDCHGSDGGWDAATYELFMNSGDNAPVVIPGEPDNSLLVQKLKATHDEGDPMPPPPIRPLSEAQIQLIVDWIAAGAPDN